METQKKKKKKKTKAVDRYPEGGGKGNINID